MGNEYTGADFAPHLLRGTLTAIVDWATSTGIKDVLMAGYHGKMFIRNIYIMNINAALNSTEPIINIITGGAGREVVATIDMATLLGSTAAVGVCKAATIADAYRTLDVDQSLQVEIETADGGSATRGLLMIDYELIE